MFNAEDQTTGPQAADVSLLNQLVLEVYLAAWTMAGVKDGQRPRRIAASSDDADDGETALDVIDVEHFIRATWGLDFGAPEGDVAVRRELCICHTGDRYLVGQGAAAGNGGSRVAV
jgi:hypothetical protein